MKKYCFLCIMLHLFLSELLNCKRLQKNDLYASLCILLSASCILVHAGGLRLQKCLLQLISELPLCCSLSYGIKYLSKCLFIIASGFSAFVDRMLPLSLVLICHGNPRFAQSNIKIASYFHSKIVTI